MAKCVILKMGDWW